MQRSSHRFQRSGIKVTKLAFFNLCLLLIFSLITVVISLPLTTHTSFGSKGGLAARRDLSLGPWTRLESRPSPPAYSASAYFSSYHPHHLNQSNGQNGLPHFHSGPWDRVWELWSGVTDRLKIVKRGVSFRVPEEITNHLRPQDWVQKTKDFWRRITFRKLKVTRAQYEQVKNKYRPTKYTAYRSQYKTDGRLRSAFVSRPNLG